MAPELKPFDWAKLCSPVHLFYTSASDKVQAAGKALIAVISYGEVCDMFCLYNVAVRAFLLCLAAAM